MRLLFVALHLPSSGQTGNALILSNYLRYLGGRHEVDLIAFGQPRARDRSELDQWCSRVEVVPVGSRAARRLAKLYGLLTNRPLSVSYYSSTAMRDAVEGMVRRRSYDAVIVQLCPAAQFRPIAFDGPLILDFEDPPALKLERTAQWLSWWPRMLARIERGRMVKYERKCVEWFDRLVFISRRDAQAFGEWHRCLEKVRHVPHGVDVSPSDTVDSSARVEGMIVMTGNMNHPPNVAAAEFVCREVFPRVREAIPNASLWIVGANPTRAVQQLATHEAVTITGRVPDVRPYLRQALVAVCGVPVVIGTQTKILEALACGTPVVTTSAGNHGIEGVSGQHLYVADDAHDFGNRIVSLLKHEGWSAMSHAGKELALDRFTTRHTGAALEAIICDALDERVATSR
jgi:glycosyltransferase involved in cell wall biosynthesis